MTPMIKTGSIEGKIEEEWKHVFPKARPAR